MVFPRFAACLACLLLSEFAVAGGYSIVVSRETYKRPEWRKVVAALVAKHQGAEVNQWKDKVTDVLVELKRQHPRYTCFVATSEESSRQFVADVHQLTRQYDPDPYADTLWGILTGYDATNALEIAQWERPLVIRKVASGTELALDMCNQGVWYDELVQHKKVSKASTGGIKEERGPADTTRALAASLSGAASLSAMGPADLFVTSGHATERDWQIGFRYRNGKFISKSGQMFGLTTDGERFRVRSRNPKVYMPIGNCLMGHINGPDAMALAWMNDVGVKQMLGYTVVTWYGYAGWGVLDYFVEQPGRYTFAEAFHANHHALIHRLDTYFDEVTGKPIKSGAKRISQTLPNQAGRSLGLTPADSRGLLWDRDTVAFYGDPAWIARMESKQKAFDQHLTINGNLYRFEVTPQLGKRSFEPINTNGSQRGWRPIIELLDHRIERIEIVSGQDLMPVVSDDFVLIPNPRVADPSRSYVVEFTASRVE